MAGRLTGYAHTTVSAATSAGYLTVGAATGFYVGAKCWLSNTANTLNSFVQIVSISGTTVGVRIIPQPALTSIGLPTYAPPNYGLSDVSAFNGGGFLDQEDQLVYNRNDAPAP